MQSLIYNSTARYIIAFIGGLLLSTSLPCIGWSIFAWLGLIPLFLLIKSSESFSSLVREVFVFAFVYYLIGFSWLVTLHPLTWQGFSLNESFFIALSSWLLPSIYHTLLIVIFAVICRLILLYSQESILTMILFSFLWVIINYKLAISFGPFAIFSVPLNHLAYSQYLNTWLIQEANIFGAIGVEFLIVFVNLILAKLILEKDVLTRIEQIVYLGLIVLIASSSVLYSLVSKEPQHNKTISYGIVQASLLHKDIRGENVTLEDLIAVHQGIGQRLNPYNELILWPEGSVPAYDRNYVDELILAPYKAWTDESPLMVYGTYFRNFEEEKIHNSIEIKDLETNSSQFYHKHKLVPFGEYTPELPFLAGPLKDLTKSSVGNGFNSGSTKQEAIETKLGKGSFNLCFELLYPSIVKAQVLSGAEFIINPSDLSWFKGKMVKEQFLAAGVFRAIENSKELLLANNSGYSAHINAKGQILEMTEADRPGIIEGILKTNNSISLFTRYGW